MIELLFTLLCLLKFSLSEQFSSNLMVRAHKTFPLLTSSVNAGDYANYTFIFRLPKNVVTPCNLEIVFPKESFVSGMGMNFKPEIQIYNPGLVTQVQTSQVKENTLSIYPKKLRSDFDVSLTIRDVKNPFKIGGIGLFEVYTKCENQVIHVNRDFANIGITEPKSGILSASVEFDPDSSQLAGEETRYIFTVFPALDVSPYSVFQIEFPSIYNLKKINEEIEDFPSYKPCKISTTGISPFTTKSDFSCQVIGQDNIILITGLGDSSLIRNREKHRACVQHQQHHQSSL